MQPNRIYNPGNGQKPVRWQPLREFAPTNSSVLAPINGSSFSPYLNSMSIMRGLDLTDFRGHDASRHLDGLGDDEGRMSLPVILFGNAGATLARWEITLITRIVRQRLSTQSVVDLVTLLQTPNSLITTTAFITTVSL